MDYTYIPAGVIPKSNSNHRHKSESKNKNKNDKVFII